MKRLIVCCDGTWNRADQKSPTNVKKLYDAIDESAGQLAWYEPGVGTRPFEHILGGGFGVGLSRNVQQCYRFLVDAYSPGDELFFFGFSRGAFTARSLAGLVRNSGILRRENVAMVGDAYKLYRSRDPGNAPAEANAQRFREAHSHPDAEIKFIGVWDTVGALGIPLHSIRAPWLTKLYGFHDTTLSRYVKNAYHALSIDERRGPFEPTLWVHKKQDDDAPAPLPPGQTVEQVWFSGVHSDVGGGYPDPSLAEIALNWLADRARACGLVLKTDHLVVTAPPCEEAKRAKGLQLAPDAVGMLHDSMTWFYKRLGPYDRQLTARDGEPINAHLASTAKSRYDADAHYRPLGLEGWIAGGKGDVDVSS
jgi:uncharacterized protein (DUF2235 family)